MILALILLIGLNKRSKRKISRTIYKHDELGPYRSTFCVFTANIFKIVRFLLFAMIIKYLPTVNEYMPFSKLNLPSWNYYLFVILEQVIEGIC